MKFYDTLNTFTSRNICLFIYNADWDEMKWIALKCVTGFYLKRFTFRHLSLVYNQI